MTLIVIFARRHNARRDEDDRPEVRNREDRRMTDARQTTRRQCPAPVHGSATGGGPSSANQW